MFIFGISKCVLMFLMIISMVSCSPPENPIKCASQNKDCTVTNSYGTFPDRSTCHAAEVVYPQTEEQLILSVANATMKNIKMKVATRFSHSIPKLVCPGGVDGLLISTMNLNRTLSVDLSNMRITVQSGVTLRQLIDESAKAGLALPYVPYWWGLTIGGLLGTGAHGSTLWGAGSAVHEYVVQVRIVTPAGPDEGYARVRTLNEGEPELNAARVSLGVLGVISQVTFQLQPMFKRSITFVTQNDSNLADQVSTFGHEHEFADMTWYPSQRRVVYRRDDRVSSNTSGNGLYEFTGFRSQPTFLLETIRITEEIQERLRDAIGKCITSQATMFALGLSANGLTNDGRFFTGYPVIGYQNRLQSSGTCLDIPQGSQSSFCPWDHRVNGLFYHQTAFSIDLTKAKSFIEDIQKLVDLAPRSLCGAELYSGFIMRYVTASNAYLGKQEDGIDFDITYYRSHDPNTPRLFEDILEEIEQLAMFKYGGLPHWGKNRNVAFNGAINKYKNGAEFLRVKEMYDPLGLFSSEWTDQVLGINGEVTIVKEGCALEGLCICSEDIHCAPDDGYFCRPGKVYADARVCTYEDRSEN